MLCNDVQSLSSFRNYIYSLFRRYSSIWHKLRKEASDEVMQAREDYESLKSDRKIDLSMGVYSDMNGHLVKLKCVHKVENILSSMNLHKLYLPPMGSLSYRKLAAKVTLGEDSEHVKNDFNVTCQGLARTGSMQIALRFIQIFYPGKKIVYVSNPTWPNYKQVIKCCNLEMGTYDYYNFKENKLDFKALCDSISKIPEKAIILIEACGHNPTGIDPSPVQWAEMSNIIKKKNLLVVMDLNSQGFASGDLDKDAYGTRMFIEDGHKVIVLQSFSKNMAMYTERIGACTFLAENKDEADRIASQVAPIIRTKYSTPPLYGARIVAMILGDEGLNSDWRAECFQMSQRLIEMRRVLVEKLYKQGSLRQWDYIMDQQGSFSFLGLTRAQVIMLRNKYNIFLTTSGRMALGNINMSNVDYVAYALHFITK